MFELTNKDIENFLKYPLGSQEGLMEEAEVVMRIFNPHGRGAWNILEIKPIDYGEDFYCFGYVESPITPQFNEYGPFMLNELREIKIPIRIKDVATGEIHDLGFGGLEIDRSIEEGTKLKEVLE